MLVLLMIYKNVSEVKIISIIMFSLAFSACETVQEPVSTANKESQKLNIPQTKPENKSGGYLVHNDLQMSYKLIKPSLENAIKCSVSAGLPISDAEDLVSCNKAVENKEIGRENLISTYLNRGMIQTKLGDYSAAFADYDKAAMLSDTKGNIYFSRAITESYRYNYSKMAELIEESLMHNVRNPKKAYFFLGGAYELDFQFDKARRAYKDSLSVDGNNTPALKALTRLDELWPE